MSEHEIWEAIESTAVAPGGAFPASGRRTASPQAVAKHQRDILRFLEEVDGDLTVSELREAVSSWGTR